MADLTQPYDELAAHYDQIFEDWEASIARQSTVLAGILDRECGERRPIRVLDCACGIGTQSLGLAMKGFDVTGCDISIGAVERARLEASKRELSVPFSVANMVQLSAIPKSSFDPVFRNACLACKAGMPGERSSAVAAVFERYTSWRFPDSLECSASGNPWL